MERRVDLNSDLGEGFSIYTIGNDEEILKVISSANIACGWHGGDPIIMDKTVQIAQKYGVGIGAHPSFPDPLGFGRRNMSITLKEAETYVLYQLGALDAFARAHGSSIQHIKLHGAFYNMASKDRDIAKSVIEAARKIREDIYFLCLSGSDFAKVGKEEGALIAEEVFADRAYNEDGSLVSRKVAGALIEDEDLAIKRTIDMVTRGKVESISGIEIPIVADSICVHGDNPKAVQFVNKIRKGLEAEGVSIKAFSKNNK